MKTTVIKSIIAIILAITITASCCACSNDTKNATTTDTRVGDALISGEDSRPNAKELCALYQEGVWGGEFISDSKSCNCVSIKDGQLYINCEKSYYIPDTPVEDQSYVFVGQTSAGTWVTNEEKIALYNKGNLITEIKTPFERFAYVANIFGDNIATYDGNGSLFVYDENGCTKYASFDVIDVWIHNDTLHVYYYSNANNECCCLEVNSDGDVVRNDTSNRVAGYKPQATTRNRTTTTEENANLQLAKLYQTNKWDGKFQYFSDLDRYAAVNSSGFIVVNNKTTAINVAIPYTQHLDKSGYNWDKDSDNNVFILESGCLKKYTNGDMVANIKIGDFEGGEILYMTDSKIAAKLYCNEMFALAIVDMDKKEATLIKDGLLDVRCAYDSLYLLDSDHVGYEIDDWYEQDIQKINVEKVMEDISFISHHEDESEGFVIANSFGLYGSIGKIYGPYCEDYTTK